MPKLDPRVTKRRVTMTSSSATADGVSTHEAVDYVLPEYLEAYVADAQTRWQSVVVAEAPDAGPGGYDGQTVVHAHLSGVGQDITRPATLSEV